MERMRVIYFHQHFSTPNGSVGIRSYKMASRLINRGHQVTMVCGSYQGGQTGLAHTFKRGRRSGNVDGIDVIEFDLAYSNADGFLIRAFTFVKFALLSLYLALTQDYDIVFATSTPLTASVPGIFARWLRRKPFIFEVRDLWPELPRAMGVIRNPLVLWAIGVLEWISYRSATRLVGLSPGIVRGIVNRGVCIKRIAMVSNGCDHEIFENEDFRPWRPNGIHYSDLMVVYAGTHGIANGLDAVLDVAGELKRRGRFDIKIVLIGQGKLKSFLQFRARKEGLDNVIFLDPIGKVKVGGLMAGADLGLQVLSNVPAFYEGTSPNKFFDYLSAGLPVLNNYPGWIAEIIKENQCGFVVSPNDANECANALEFSAINRESLKGMGQRARSLAHRQFSFNKLADYWVDWVTGIDNEAVV